MKKLLLASTALAGGLALCQPVSAVDYTVSVDFEVRDALSMSEIQAMDFGVFEVYTFGPGIIHLDDGANGSNSTMTAIDTSAMANGRYQIAGSSNATISISASDAGNVSDIEFSKLVCAYNASKTPVTLIGTGSSTMTGLSAPGAGTILQCDDVELQIDDSVPEGSYSPQISFTVSYE